MVSKTMNRVILAEKQAAEKVDLANEKSQQIISTANEKAKEIIKKAKQESNTEAESLMQINKIQITEIFDNNNKISINEASEIRTKVHVKREKAIDMVIKKIISQ